MSEAWAQSGTQNTIKYLYADIWSKLSIFRRYLSVFSARILAQECLRTSCVTDDWKKCIFIEFAENISERLLYRRCPTRQNCFHIDCKGHPRLMSVRIWPALARIVIFRIWDYEWPPLWLCWLGDDFRPTVWFRDDSQSVSWRFINKKSSVDSDHSKADMTLWWALSSASLPEGRTLKNSFIHRPLTRKAFLYQQTQISVWFYNERFNIRCWRTQWSVNNSSWKSFVCQNPATEEWYTAPRWRHIFSNKCDHHSPKGFLFWRHYSDLPIAFLAFSPNPTAVFAQHQLEYCSRAQEIAF